MTTNYRPECGEGSHGGPRFINELYQFLGPKGLVLDCGCGTGYKTEYIKSNGLEVVSIDIDMCSLKILRDRAIYTNSVNAIICGDVQYLPFKPGIFDSVLCSEVLEHLPNPELCIHEVCRTMKKGGTAVFTTPVFNLRIGYLITVWRKICGIEDDRSHLHVFSTKLLKKYFKDCYSIEHVIHRGYTELLVIKFGFDKGGRLDSKLIKLSERCTLIKLFSSKIWIKLNKT